MIGETFQSKTGDFVVLERRDNDKILIRFVADGYEKEVFRQVVYKGNVKNPYYPNVYGIGFFGEGPHKARENGCEVRTYKLWNHVIERCYSPRVHFKRQHYSECSVDKQWHNYQEFAEWCQWQTGFSAEWTLDKDLIVPKNKIYSPDKCIFLPNEINTSLNFKRSGRYCGVSFHKASNKFVAQIRCGEDSLHLGLFNCEEQAYLAYKAAKESQIKSLASKYKNELSEIAFEALMLWEVKDRV